MIKLYRDTINEHFIIEKDTYEFTSKLILCSNEVLYIVSFLYNFYINKEELIINVDNFNIYHNKEDESFILKQDTKEGYISLTLEKKEVNSLMNLLINELEGDNISYIIETETINHERETKTN